MSKREKILDDLASVAGGAVGAITDAKRSVSDVVKSQVQAMAQDMDLVPREEFEKLELMVTKLREEQEAMKKEIEALKGKK